MLAKWIYVVFRMFFHWKIIDFKFGPFVFDEGWVFFRCWLNSFFNLSLVFLSIHPSLPQISYLIEPHGFVINCMITSTEWKCKSSHSARLHACQIWKSVYLTSAWVEVWTGCQPNHFFLSFLSFSLLSVGFWQHGRTETSKAYCFPDSDRRESPNRFFMRLPDSSAEVASL